MQSRGRCRPSCWVLPTGCAMAIQYCWTFISQERCEAFNALLKSFCVVRIVSSLQQSKKRWYQSTSFIKKKHQQQEWGLSRSWIWDRLHDQDPGSPIPSDWMYRPRAFHQWDRMTNSARIVFKILITHAITKRMIIIENQILLNSNQIIIIPFKINSVYFWGK